MKEFLINFFFGVLCGAGITMVVEMTIVASLSFVNLIKEFKEKWRKKDDT